MNTNNSSSNNLYGLPRLDKRWIWIGLGVLTLFVNYLFKLNPAFTEIIYSRGIFVIIRTVWDYTLGWLPFPLLYLLVPIVAIWSSHKLVVTIRNYKMVKWRYRLGSLLISGLALTGGIFFVFQFLWGFNYHRVSVADQMGLMLSQPDSAMVYAEAELATRMMIEARANIPGAQEESLREEHLPSNLEAHMRENLHIVLKTWNYPTPGRVRGRRVFPKGLLMRLGATGIYIPFAGEGHIDAALPPVNRPFTLAHELSHGYGIGNEGNANFWAYLSTEQSSYPSVKYSGRLSYWRYTMRQLRLLDPEAFKMLYNSVPPGVIADLQKIRNVYNQYPDFFPKINQQVYHSYLRSQGVKEGILSYHEVIAMVRAWREKTKDPQQPDHTE